jgi:hypothetical protein
MGQDINFEFKGFSVHGSVISSGFNEGPSGVNLVLSGGPHNLQMKTTTSDKGKFQFESISPGGPYTLTASHPSLQFLSSTHSFTIANKNLLLDNHLVVSGYELGGRVGSDGNPVEKVTLVLLSKDGSKINPPKGCSSKGGEGLKLPEDIQGDILCVETSDKNGIFTFKGLSPGNYLVLPVYK